MKALLLFFVSFVCFPLAYLALTKENYILFVTLGGLGAALFLAGLILNHQDHIGRNRK